MSASALETLILKSTSISEGELKTLLNIPDARGEAIIHKLASRTYTSPEEALADLCKAIGSEFTKDIAYNDIPVDLVRNIPINYAKNHEVLPFKVEGDRALILLTNPLNLRILGDMRVIFAKKNCSDRHDLT